MVKANNNNKNKNNTNNNNKNNNNNINNNDNDDVNNNNNNNDINKIRALLITITTTTTEVVIHCALHIHMLKARDSRNGSCYDLKSKRKKQRELQIFFLTESKCFISTCAKKKMEGEYFHFD